MSNVFFPSVHLELHKILVMAFFLKFRNLFKDSLINFFTKN
jgi:hypothetical protein